MTPRSIRRVAEQLSPQLDSGKRYDAVVAKLLDTLVPVVDVRLPSTTTASATDNVPLAANYMYRETPTQTGPNAGQIAMLIILVILGILLRLLKTDFGRSSKSVHVGGYTRSDGTSVSGYDRAAPGTK